MSDDELPPSLKRLAEEAQDKVFRARLARIARMGTGIDEPGVCERCGEPRRLDDAGREVHDCPGPPGFRPARPGVQMQQPSRSGPPSPPRDSMQAAMDKIRRRDRGNP